MEADFSDKEFDDLLGAFAEFDDMLLDGDFLQGSWFSQEPPSGRLWQWGAATAGPEVLDTQQALIRPSHAEADIPRELTQAEHDQPHHLEPTTAHLAPTLHIPPSQAAAAVLAGDGLSAAAPARDQPLAPAVAPSVAPSLPATGEPAPVQWPAPVVVTTGQGGFVTWSIPGGTVAAAEPAELSAWRPGSEVQPPTQPPPLCPINMPETITPTTGMCGIPCQTRGGGGISSNNSSSGMSVAPGGPPGPWPAPLGCARSPAEPLQSTASTAAQASTAAPNQLTSFVHAHAFNPVPPSGTPALGAAPALPSPTNLPHGNTGHMGSVRPLAAAVPPAAPAAPGGGGGGVSGAALLAELLAEAAVGAGSEWRSLAAAAGLAPLLPATGPGAGRSAEELLAGLDLADVFAPPKVSHAKRIRGHVRRAAELRSALAARVRSVQALAAENAALRGRARVLELVLQCRDEQLRLLRAHSTSADGRTYRAALQLRAAGPGAAAVGQEAGTAAGWSLESELSELLPGAAGGGGGGVGALAHMPAAALLELFGRLVSRLSASLAAVEAAGVAGQAPAGAAGTAGQAPLLPGPPGQPPLACAAWQQQQQQQQQPLLAARSADAADAGWAAAAPAAQGAPAGCPLARLRGQMSLYRGVVRYLWLVNDEVARFVDTTLTGETAPPEPGHWLHVALGLGLGPEQLADAAALHACWQEWLGRTHSERRSIAAALDQLLSVNRYGASYSESVGQYGTDRDAIHAMHANVMREKVLTVLVAEVFCCHILTDLQWARAIVASRPYVMDARELLRAAAQLAGAASGQGLGQGRGLPLAMGRA